MRITFVIITVGDRTNDLNLLIKSIINNPKFNDYDINMLFQGTDDEFNLIENKDCFKSIIKTNERLGCHTARLRLLKSIKYDCYINLDDDMELVEHTDYSLPIQFVTNKRVGFILTNWARTRNLLDQKVPKKRPEFVPQILCYNGGGMVYNNEIADLMRQMPEQKTAFDNAWSLTSYINGFTNYRFLGSLAIHKVCRKGGMQKFMAENPANLMMSEYIDFKKAKIQRGNGYDFLIPLDKDVNQKARDLHKMNKNEKRAIYITTN